MGSTTDLNNLIDNNNTELSYILQKPPSQQSTIYFYLNIQICHLPYYNVNERFETLEKSWPHVKPSLEDIAIAGLFFKQGKEEQSCKTDVVTCFACRQSLGDWQQDDDPMIEHAKLYPSCPFIILKRCHDMQMGELEVIDISNRAHDQLKSLSLLCSDRNPVFKLLVSLKYDVDVLTTLIIRKFFAEKTKSKEVYPTAQLLLDDAIEAVLGENLLSYETGIQEALTKIASLPIVLPEKYDPRRNQSGSGVTQADPSKKSRIINDSAHPASPVGAISDSVTPQYQTESERLYADNMRIIAQSVCKGCYHHRSNNVIIPCGHLSLCDNCKEDYLNSCPVCGTKPTKIIRVYSS